MGVGFVGIFHSLVVSQSVMDSHSRTVGGNTGLKKRNRFIGRPSPASHSTTVGGVVCTFQLVAIHQYKFKRRR